MAGLNKLFAINIFNFACRSYVYVATLQLCYYSRKAAINNMQIIGVAMFQYHLIYKTDGGWIGTPPPT